LSDIGKSPLRVAAKNVNFGIPYGRSAEAIARQCREEGVDVTIDECQQMIDFYFEQYPGTANFLQECRDRSQSPGWVAGSFGRMRRFIRTRERSVIKEQERQAQNFPIQNTVADALWLAIHNFHKYKKEHTEAKFRMQLPIHDALLFEVPVVQVRDFVTHILPKCMVHDVPIWPRRLDNTPMAVSEPYHFSIDIDIQEHWGEKLPAARREELGIADLC
jgi:DNA polymerase-1